VSKLEAIMMNRIQNVKPKFYLISFVFIGLCRAAADQIIRQPGSAVFRF
jgi:hypothetical protein